MAANTFTIDDVPATLGESVGASRTWRHDSPLIRDLAGQRFGRLVVQRIAPKDPAREHRLWVCRCDCGAETVVFGHALKSGHTKSCGCLHRELRIQGNTTHGLARTPTHRIWCGMINRCHNPGNQDFENYGGRGITVCERWRESFPAFLADMGERPARMSIERIDNSKGYEPGNCRWATQKEQTRNRRGLWLIEFRGETKCAADWAEQYGLTGMNLRNRLRLGWSIERALTTPVLSRSNTNTGATQ